MYTQKNKIMKKSLLIVESPTKAKTISGFLPKTIDVVSTKGHIEDLPKSKFGIDVEHNFVPQYEVMKDKKNLISDLIKKANNSSIVYIATDPDREGEAIGWHIFRVLKLKKSQVERITFHEITESAIKNAMQNPADINENLVNAQQARRVLDRIVGYKLSPLLWEKVRYGLSAGRVQSVALRLIVDREKERNSFSPVEYWDIVANIIINGTEIDFTLSKINNKSFKISSESEASEIINKLSKGEVVLRDFKKSKSLKKAPPPYITSTLQQDANNKLGFSSKKTMMLAQSLYEGVSINGKNNSLITYMRTDSVVLSSPAIGSIRNFIKGHYDKSYLPDKENIYRTKNKLAQEAHEAVRPSYFDKDPESLKPFLSKDQFRLYDLIWKRTIASQMSDSVYENKKMTIDIKVDKEIYTFIANSTIVSFDGYSNIYNYERVINKNFKNIENIGDVKSIKLNKFSSIQHFTEPPPRYNDASLVKELEFRGIGRPSTYATIISTLITRGYITRVNRYLSPTDVGCVVSDFLCKYFEDIVDVKFTADMEDQLDSVANGKFSWINIVSKFYYPFEKKIEENKKLISKSDVTNLGESEEKCPECGSSMIIKLGKYGRFLSCKNFPTCKGMKSIDGNENYIDEKCPKCGSNLILKRGRYGEFIACSNYPTCKFTKPLKEKEKKVLDIKCPECAEGQVVELKNKRNKVFYGCTMYPKCKFTASNIDNLS